MVMLEYNQLTTYVLKFSSYIFLISFYKKTKQTNVLNAQHYLVNEQRAICNQPNVRGT